MVCASVHLVLTHICAALKSQDLILFEVLWAAGCERRLRLRRRRQIFWIFLSYFARFGRATYWHASAVCCRHDVSLRRWWYWRLVLGSRRLYDSRLLRCHQYLVCRALVLWFAYIVGRICNIWCYFLHLKLKAFRDATVVCERNSCHGISGIALLNLIITGLAVRAYCFRVRWRLGQVRLSNISLSVLGELCSLAQILNFEELLFQHLLSVHGFDGRWFVALERNFAVV